jgi:hypothetical protein
MFVLLASVLARQASALLLLALVALAFLLRARRKSLWVGWLRAGPRA